MSKPTRRQHERYACEMVVWLRPEGTDDEFQLVDVENISSGGILCTTLSPLEDGAVLELQVSLMQLEKMVTVKAKVCHTSPLENGEFNHGLQFLETKGIAFPTFMACLEAMFS